MNPIRVVKILAAYVLVRIIVRAMFPAKVTVYRAPAIKRHEYAKSLARLISWPNDVLRFNPTPWLFNGHLQTIFLALGTNPERFGIKFRRQQVQFEGGGSASLDWSLTFADLPADAPTLIILHGLTGGSHEYYLQSLISELEAKLRWRVVVYNARGCADMELTSPQMYCGAYTDDIRFAVGLVKQAFPQSPLLAIGYSLGSNILVKYLGEEGPNCPIVAAASMGNPFDLMTSMRHLEHNFLYRELYSRQLAKNLKRVFSKHAHWFQASEEIRVDDVYKSSVISEFDDNLTRRVFGYVTVHEYYRDASSCRYVPKVAIPLLCMQALDDPICAEASIPYDECSVNPLTVLITSSTGGHLGWLSGWRAQNIWVNRVVLHFFQETLKLKAEGKLADLMPGEPIVNSNPAPISSTATTTTSTTTPPAATSKNVSRQSSSLVSRPVRVVFLLVILFLLMRWRK